MRIISGCLKGMVLSDKVSTSTRPTSDRLRETIFSILQSRYDLTNTKVVDLYAGTGALGLEAFSRGAKDITFVETNLNAINVIDNNVMQAKRRIPDIGNFEIIRTPVLTFAQKKENKNQFDYVFADPPYDFDVEEEIAQLIKPQGILIYETSDTQQKLCEETLMTNPFIKDIIVSRTSGSSAVIIAHAI